MYKPQNIVSVLNRYLRCIQWSELANCLI